MNVLRFPKQDDQVRGNIVLLVNKDTDPPSENRQLFPHHNLDGNSGFIIDGNIFWGCGCLSTDIEQLLLLIVFAELEFSLEYQYSLGKRYKLRLGIPGE